MVMYVLRNEETTVRTTPAVNEENRGEVAHGENKEGHNMQNGIARPRHICPAGLSAIPLDHGTWIWIPPNVSNCKAGLSNIRAFPTNDRDSRDENDRGKDGLKNRCDRSSNGRDKHDGSRDSRSSYSRSMKSRSRDRRRRNSRSRHRRSGDRRSRNSRSRDRKGSYRRNRDSRSRSRERGNDRYYRNRDDTRSNSRCRECRNGRYHRNPDDTRSDSRNNRGGRNNKDERTRQSSSLPNSHRQVGAPTATDSTLRRSLSRPNLPDHHQKFHESADFKMPKKDEKRQGAEHSGSHGTGDQLTSGRGNPPGTGNARTRRSRNSRKRKKAIKAQAATAAAATDPAAVHPVVANPNDVELVKIDGVLSKLSCNQDDTADIAAERAIKTVPENLDVPQNEVMKRSEPGPLLNLDQESYLSPNSAQEDRFALMSVPSIKVEPKEEIIDLVDDTQNEPENIVSAPRIKVEPKEEIINLVDDNQNEPENIKPVLESIKRKDAAVLEAAAAAAAGTNGAEGFSQWVGKPGSKERRKPPGAGAWRTFRKREKRRLRAQAASLQAAAAAVDSKAAESDEN